MHKQNRLVVIFYRSRSAYYRTIRLVFPSHAEVQFIKLMGGHVVQFRRIRPFRNREPLTIVRSLGRILRDENFKREVRIGKYFVDFANDLGRIIEIDGAAYHMDVVADFDRSIYIQQRLPDSRTLRIKAYHVYNNRNKVQRDTMKFVQF